MTLFHICSERRDRLLIEGLLGPFLFTAETVRPGPKPLIALGREMNLMSLHAHDLRLLALLTASVVMLFSAAASATTITLSEMSSETADIPPGTPASALDGIVGFEIGEFDGGNAGDEIQLTFENTTSGGFGAGDYDVSEIWLSLSSDITIGSILSPAVGANLGWELGAPPATMVDGFGLFNLGVTLIGDVNLNPDLILPGETAAILISFACAGTCDESDLINNAKGKAAAAKFLNGGDVYGDPNDSALGASAVPEPSTALLMSLGLAGLAAVRRRTA
jgi:hypothetical protein